MIISACSAIGFASAASYHKEERLLKQLQQVLGRMECALSCHVSRLSQLFWDAREQCGPELGSVMHGFAVELDRQVSADAGSCMNAVLDRAQRLPKSVRELLAMLGSSLGEFDLSGQLKQLSEVRCECAFVLQEHTANKDKHIRIRQALGICAGLVLVIIIF